MYDKLPALNMSNMIGNESLKTLFTEKKKFSIVQVLGSDINRQDAFLA